MIIFLQQQFLVFSGVSGSSELVIWSMIIFLIALIVLFAFTSIRAFQKNPKLNQFKTLRKIDSKGFGDKDTHPIYKGDVKNGVPNGLGFLIFPNTGN